MLTDSKGQVPSLWSCPTATATESYIQDTLVRWRTALASQSGSTTELQGMEGTSLGGELVLVSTCLTVTPLITGGQEHTHYPQASNCFDVNYFFTIDSKDKLISMIKSPNTIDGCKLVTNISDSRQSSHRKKTWTFLCYHGKVMKVTDDCQFHHDNVGKSNISIQHLKCTKSKGSTF